MARNSSALAMCRKHAHMRFTLLLPDSLAVNSERNLVVQIAATLEAAAAFGRAHQRRPLAALTITPRIQHHELAAEALQHDFRRVFLGAVLVGVFARLELALEIDLRALAQILLGDLAQVLVEDHDAVPLGLFLPLARRLVTPGFGGCNGEVDHGIAGGQTPHLRVAPEIADQYDFVDAPRHCSSPCVLGLTLTLLPVLHYDDVPFSTSFAEPSGQRILADVLVMFQALP